MNCRYVLDRYDETEKRWHVRLAITQQKFEKPIYKFSNVEKINCLLNKPTRSTLMLA